MHPLLNIAISAARKAGDIILRHVDRIDRLTIREKQHNDFVSEVDRLAEQEIIYQIHKAYPDHGILAEESGAQGNADGFQWIIDPLDGTTNFLHGFPAFAVSIAVRFRGRLEHGVVYDPMRQELFTTSRGTGAQLDGKRMRVTARKSLDGALIGTGFPFRESQNLPLYIKMFDSVVRRTAGVRRAGSAALDLAYVAAGRLDGFWEMGLKPWDIAAGALLIQEAGGLVGHLDGAPGVPENGDILVGGEKIFKAMADAFKPLLAAA
ncbi:MAG: inositol monophosphatase family protein [Gammaproteobacteria bacterium]